ncbi:MAG: hypothetical protein M0Z52_02545 [Actinomycetota bacterium]|nr:hypothetical protein [Actinomycetota bacterium]
MKLQPQEVDGLLAKLRGNNMEIPMLDGEIRKIAAGPDQILSKFREILGLLEEVIADEKRRYKTAIRTLAAASGLNQQDVLKAASNQLEELETLKDEFMAALSGGDEFKAMESRVQEIRGQKSNLMEKLARLEAEEQKVLGDMADKEKDTGLAKKSLEKIFTEAMDEISGIKAKLEGLSQEKTEILETVTPKTAAAPSQPAPPEKAQPLPGNGLPGEGETAAAESAKTADPYGTDTQWQKKCPNCGSKMNFFLNDKKWLCYVCAFEELKDGSGRDNDESAGLASEGKPEPQLQAVAQTSEAVTNPPGLSVVRYSAMNAKMQVKKKNCPVCRKKMVWGEADKTWRCTSCEYFYRTGY